MKRKYIIFAPPYNEKSGGSVVLHKLCSILNDLGYDSYLFPYFETFRLDKMGILRYIKSKILNYFKNYHLNSTFNTRIYNLGIKDITDLDIVIYPEVVYGNPLKAKNVIRWLLHQPGFHTGEINYCKNELYFKFNSAIKDFNFNGSKTSKLELKIIHYPLEIYNNENISFKRFGTAYCLRKGRNKKIQHDLENSILIDEKNNEDIAKIFKNVTTFISYDTYTAYSIFAVLCGCRSVVIPDENVSIEEWYPNELDRYGISYGFSPEELARAEITAPLVKKHILKEEQNNINNIKLCINEINIFFKIHNEQL